MFIILIDINSNLSFKYRSIITCNFKLNILIKINYLQYSHLTNKQCYNFYYKNNMINIILKIVYKNKLFFEQNNIYYKI